MVSVDDHTLEVLDVVSIRVRDQLYFVKVRITTPRGFQFTTVFTIKSPPESKASFEKELEDKLKSLVERAGR